MRSKPDVDKLSMDDLYNNLKVYEAEIKGQSNSTSSSQNVAFVSSEDTSNTNELVNIAHSISAASSQSQLYSSSYADDVMFSFFANQSSSPQLDNEDLEQIDTDDLEEMDLKWQMAMLTMRVKRFINKTGRKLKFNGKETGNRNRENARRHEPVEAPANNALVVQDGISGYDWSFQAEEGPTNFALMAYSSPSSSSFDTKTGLGFDSQMNENELHNKVFVSIVDSVFESQMYESDLNESEKEDNPVNNRSDLSFVGLDDFVYKSVVSESKVSKPDVKTSKPEISKVELKTVSEPIIYKPRVFNNAPIIEEWESDCDEENDLTFVNEKLTYTQAEHPRKFSQSPKDNRRNWNEMMTQKLGVGFEFKKKACFVCGSFYHLIKEYDFHKKKMVAKTMLNNRGKGTGQREVRPV
ncbi:hypothetical protein Tco_1195872 [Tanacetum coccineum]